MALLSALMTEIVIPVCAIIGIAFSLVQWCHGLRNSDNLINEEQGLTANKHRVDKGKIDKITSDVSEGVKYFLFTEYQYVGVFMAAFAILIFLFLGSVESFSTQSRPCMFDPLNMCKPALATAVFSTVSFLLGAFTSVLSGFLGMKIAIYANARTAVEGENGVGRTFVAASGSGAIMGFLLAAIGLLGLYLAICLFKWYYGNDWEGLFEAITSYGLGGASMALFGRACGGIYAKAADVCVHLVKRMEPNIIQDKRNPAVIPNNVGDVVGDIAGMGTDLFGFYAESSCTALVVASVSSFGIDHDFTAMCYPLLISSMGIIVCLITTLLANFFRIKKVEEIRPALKWQLLVSLCLMSVGVTIVSWIALPSTFAIYNFGSQKVVKKAELSLCVLVGLWARQISGFFLKCYTINRHRPVQDDGSCGLANVIIPIIAIAISIFVSFSFAATYGIAAAAIGMLSTMPTGLAIDAYGPISHTAGFIDAAGNTNATSEKGFSIGSAVLVSLALFGAFASRAAISPVEVLTVMAFIGLIVGAILPLKFSAMTMKIVGSAGLMMADQVLREDFPSFERGYEDPDYATYVEILTDAAIRGMILPGALVILIPIMVGTFFGVEMLFGVLAGSLVSIVWIATSSSYAGGAWNRAEEYIRAGASEHARTLSGEESSRLQEAARRGDTIGNPQKDTSGSPLNVLIQLMAVESLVFAPFFVTHGGLLFKIF